MGIVEDLEALRLFNEKAAELRESRFTQMALHPETGIEISFGHEQPYKVERTGPDDEALKAFLLTFRFLVQDNEQCSIRNVAAAYERLSVPDERKNLVRRARRSERFSGSANVHEVRIGSGVSSPHSGRFSIRQSGSQQERQAGGPRILARHAGTLANYVQRICVCTDDVPHDYRLVRRH